MYATRIPLEDSTDPMDGVTPCAPAFVTDALFPVALTLTLVGVLVVAAVVWAKRRWDLELGLEWFGYPAGFTAAALVLLMLSTQTC